MMRAGPTPTPRAAVMRHAERLASTLGALTSVRYFGPATLVLVEATGTLEVKTVQPGFSGTITRTFTGLAVGVWHPMPPFAGFGSGSTVGEVVVGYQ